MDIGTISAPKEQVRNFRREQVNNALKPTFLSTTTHLYTYMFRTIIRSRNVLLKTIYSISTQKEIVLHGFSTKTDFGFTDVEKEQKENLVYVQLFL